jgi:hypothetical protein
MVERGEIGRYAYDLHAEDDDFGQAGTLVRDVLDDAERDRMLSNIVGHVSQDVSDDVRRLMIGYWASVDANLGARVAAGLGCGRVSARRGARTRHGTYATVLLLQMAARALGLCSGFWARCNRSTSAISARHGRRVNRDLGGRRDRLEEAHPPKGENT